MLNKKIISSFLAVTLGSALSVSCGTKKKNDKQPESAAPAGLTVASMSESVTHRTINGSVVHSHLFLAFKTSEANAGMAKVEIDGIAVGKGSSLVGDSETILMGSLTEADVAEMTFGKESEEAETAVRKSILETYKDQPFLYARGYSKSLTSGEDAHIIKSTMGNEKVIGSVAYSIGGKK